MVAALNKTLAEIQQLFWQDRLQREVKLESERWRWEKEVVTRVGLGAGEDSMRRY